MPIFKKAATAQTEPNREIEAICERILSTRRDYTQASPASILAEREGDLATAKELESLRAVQGKMELLTSELNKLAGTLHGAPGKAAQAAYAADPTPENLEALKNKLLTTQAQSIVHSSEDISELINLKWLFYLLIALVSVEWFIRKFRGSY